MSRLQMAVLKCPILKCPSLNSHPQMSHPQVLVLNCRHAKNFMYFCLNYQDLEFYNVLLNRFNKQSD